MTSPSRSVAAGQDALTEFAAKQFLAAHGIPIPREALAPDAEAAADAATRLGFPVAVKASGPGLAHKTEVGGIALNLRAAEDVRREGRRLLAVPGCDGLLVAEMVPGVREVVCGLMRDPNFGPCVMFGVGGVLTEALEDAVFRVAPLTQADAMDMLHQIRATKLLGAFRGEAPADLEALAAILTGLGEIACTHPEIAAIDLNPVKIRPDGAPVAVDALVLRAPARVGEADQADRPRGSLQPFFEPHSVAIIGASAVPGKAGHELIRNIQANGFAGRLYPVNPKGGEILGLPVSRTVAALPHDVDLALVVLPAEATPAAVRDCAAKGIRSVVCMAGGFAEVDEAGIQVQRELEAIVRQTGIRLMGPNISGHTSTPAAFTSAFFPLGKIRRGSVSVIAQTGNFATHTMKYISSGEHYGLARVIGLGNKVDLDETDGLEYLAEDPETAGLVLYLESFKRPARFLAAARRLTRQKPVVMLKGGTTEAGRHAAVAHTAALAAEDRIVDGMLRQAGIVRVTDYTHLLLALKALSMLPLPAGNRVSFLAPSGALLVVLSDLCTRLGLEVPALRPENVQRLQEISPPYIRMRNPVDIWASATVRGVEFAYREGMEAVLRDPAVDAVVPVLMLTRDIGMPSFEFLLDLRARYPKKPILVTFSGDKGCMEECKAFLEPRGVPTFFDLEDPFVALSILVRCAQSMARPA
jgi:acyl-CoA synthetase (NDP forming)